VPANAPKSTGRPAELRIALVCYGGVSLAVYMHGVTKELHKLVRASRAYDDDPTQNPFPESGSTEYWYFETLGDLERQNRRLSVSLDIIAGTSAGGINGVFLAKALAVNVEQEGLKRLWIEEGDLRRLLRTNAVGGLPAKALFAILRQLRHAGEATSPLKGERMSQLLREALDGMDDGPQHGGERHRTTLLPEDGRLQLFVTTTDLNGFEVLVPSGIGGASQRDRYHAQVVQFEGTADQAQDFEPSGNPTLAFAARATSSFPGAFSPVSATSFASEAGLASAPYLGGMRLKFQYDDPEQSAQTSWFADGGILDNAPFDHVIDAIAARPAESEVLRRVVYIQPDPGLPLGAAPAPEPARKRWWRKGSRRRQPTDPMSWLSSLVRVAGTAAGHPVLRELLQLRDMNLRIAQVGDIATREMAQVERDIEAALTAKGLLSGTADESGLTWTSAAASAAIANDPPAIQAAVDAVREHAAKVLAPTWATYQRLKVDAAGRRLADELSRTLVYPRDSSRSSFLRAAIAAWARQQPVWMDSDPSALADLLGSADIPYRERRVMFLLAGVNELYSASEGPPREQLDALKHKGWELLAALRWVTTSTIEEAPRTLTGFLSSHTLEASLLLDPARFAGSPTTSAAFLRLLTHYRDALAAKTTVKDGGGELWSFFEETTRDWRPHHRSGLLARYMGFPMWDAVIFPTVALSQLPQFTPIPVSQFSPLAASLLPTPEHGKLKGMRFSHFSGFFKTEWRENDYLWGRLDGAELILRSLRDALQATPQQPVGTPGPVPPADALTQAGGQLAVNALRAVLDSEGDLASADVRSRIDTLRKDLDRLSDSDGAAAGA
jgi:patatin-related protein